MSDHWRSTTCILCYVNCGLEVATEGRSIVRVRGDRANQRSHGYLCQKAQHLPLSGEHAERIANTKATQRPYFTGSSPK